MSRRAVLSLLGVLILSLVSARPGLRSVEAAPVLSESIHEISVEPRPDQTVIRVQTGRPPTYTVFELVNPPTLVIDLAETALGPYTEGIPVHHGAVKAILPSRIFGRAARLEIALTRPVKHTVRAEGQTLLVAVARSPEDVPQDKPQDEEDMAHPEPATTPGRQATRLTAVNVDHRDGLRIVMAANGALAPKVFRVGPPYRVVIDLPGVMNVVRPLTIPVNDPVLKRVRIGQHQQRARVVLDLDEAAPYEVTQGENRLVVRLGHQGETSKAPLAQSTSSDLPPAMAQRERPRELPKVAAAATPAKPPMSKAQQKAPSETQTETPPPKAQIETASPATPDPSGAPVSTEIGKKRYTGKLISLDFEEADLRDVLRYIAEATGENLVISEDVSGEMTLKLASVPWDQALDLVLRTNGLGMQEIAGIRRIAPLGTIEKMQEEENRAAELSLKVGELITRVIPLAYARPDAVAGIAKKSLSTRGSVEVDSRTNAIIVKDTAPVVRDITELAKTLDSPTKQVMIEARMVQAVPSFARGLGVQWGGGYASRSGEFNIQAQGLATNLPPAVGAFSPNFAVNLPASPTAGAIGAVTVGRLAGGTMTLDLRLSAGETQGLTKIVSAPRIMVLDNMEAKISQGENIPFQTASQQGTNIQFFSAALTLSVTPHVTSTDTILLKIVATKNAPGDVIPGVGARIITKEVNTQVLVKDGETLVIGGIFETAKTSAETRVPWLHRIPILGWLFKSKTETENISELLVFVTPRIVR